MRVRFERAGGFAAPAMRRTITIDSDTLPNDQMRELSDLVASAGVENLPTRRDDSSPARPDEFHYRLTIEDGGHEHTVVASDTDMPAGLRPLIAWLARRA